MTEKNATFFIDHPLSFAIRVHRAGSQVIIGILQVSVFGQKGGQKFVAF